MTEGRTVEWSHGGAHDERGPGGEGYYDENDLILEEA